MRRGLTLLLFGVLLATAWADSSSSEEEEEENGDEEENGFEAQRVDDDSFRLERLEAKLHDIEDKLKEAEGGDVDHSIDVATRLEALEGNGCSDGEFHCGSDNHMCVSSMLACDGVEDCPNGYDETEDTCKNRATSGSIFVGRIHWIGCKANPDGDIKIKVTFNQVYNYFHSRVWLESITTFDTRVHAHSFKSSGSYDFGRRQMSLASDDEHVDAECHFITDDIVDCDITSEHTTCAHVRLHRDD